MHCEQPCGHALANKYFSFIFLKFEKINILVSEHLKINNEIIIKNES